MNDKELLEWAAKAAGFAFAVVQVRACFVYEKFAGESRRPRRWNPLTDDGDAFRLAVKLGLHVYGRSIGGSVDDEFFVDEADCGNDPYAATRRAIVLAAADIGLRLGSAK